MKTVTVEDIYIELEAIFDNTDLGLERRISVYSKLNELLPKWEGYKHQIIKKGNKQDESKVLNIVNFQNFLIMDGQLDLQPDEVKHYAEIFCNSL